MRDGQNDDLSTEDVVVGANDEEVMQEPTLTKEEADAILRKDAERTLLENEMERPEIPIQGKVEKIDPSE